jgi:uncharacterized repeat protein (TIGR03803 family)
VFKVTAAGSLTTLHSFDSTDGYIPAAGLLQGTDGIFYGTTSGGGSDSNCPGGCGTVFSLATGSGPFVAFVNDYGKIGAKVEILGQGFKGATAVSFNGAAAKFAIHLGTYLTATVPSGATSGFVTVTTPKRKLRSNKIFRIVR